MVRNTFTPDDPALPMNYPASCSGYCATRAFQLMYYSLKRSLLKII